MFAGCLVQLERKHKICVVSLGEVLVSDPTDREVLGLALRDKDLELMLCPLLGSGV